MEQRTRPTGAGLLAIELAVDIGIFAMCAAICIGLFVCSEKLSRSDGDLTRAVSAAKSASESFKAYGGDLDRVAGAIGGAVEDGRYAAYYDTSWQLASGPEEAFFEVIITPREEDGVVVGALSVTSESDGRLLSWEVSALPLSEGAQPGAAVEAGP